MNKYKFTVIGDSFAIPRMACIGDFTIGDINKSKGEIEIKGSEIYPEYIKEYLDIKFHKILFSFMNISSHANTSYNALNRNCLNMYMEQSDFLILGIGLVDCWNRKGINFAPFPHMLGKDPWVSIEEYEKNIRGVIKFSFNVCKTVKYIFMMNIPLVTEEAYGKQPNSYERTIEYNRILKKIATENKDIVLIDIFSYFEKIEKSKFKGLFCKDNLHYNGKGNKIVAEQIFEKVETIISYFEAERLYHENEVEEALKYIQEIDKNQLMEDYQRKVERLERICLKKS